MSAAEFKTLREAVGLSISTLVKVIDVDERSIRKWESGKKKVPQDVFEKVVAIDKLLTDTANEEIEKFKAAPTDSVVLQRFIDEDDLHEEHPEFEGLPIMSYGAMVYRLRQKYLDLGVLVTVEYK
ncbi:MAG: helix-turn-helix domain-containing protein [Bermanella sp.]